MNVSERFYRMLAGLAHPARSAFLAVLIAAVTCVALPQTAAAQVVRKSIEDLTDAELTSLRRGVATMMARNTAPRGSADFMRSWVFWANMHSHFGGTCRGPVTGAGMTGVTAWTASNPTEQATWCRCTHRNDQFLTWHRMYIYFFERVLREASQDPALTLPYWDYATDRELPVAFRELTYVNGAGQTVPNPLRVEGRRAAINAGSSLSAGTVASSNAMAATTYSSFRTRLESGPHGPVHCALSTAGCPSGLMGSVFAAANDPIFYLHHANIDRLYECWLQVDEDARLPTATGILNRTYSFVDAGGAVVSRRARDMLTTAVLGYSYAEGAGCPAPPFANQEVAQMDVELQRGLTTVPLAVETDAAPADAMGALRDGGAGVAPAPPVTVIVDGLKAARIPGVLYNVYLADGAGARAQIGVIDFFASEASGHAGHGDAGRRFDFDATSAIETLGLEPNARLNLIFEPTTGLADSTVDAAVAAIPTDAKVRFRRAWLKVGE